MRWIKNYSGSLVNLDRAYFIYVEDMGREWAVMADFLFHNQEEDKIEKIYLKVFKTEEEANEYIEAILIRLS